jgi:PPOX class probable F420-dependent enzyme
MSGERFEPLVRVGEKNNFLAVVSTARADGSVQSTLVNAGVIDHPVTGEPVVAFVTYGRTKLANLRARPRVALTFTAGWQYATVEGPVEIIGPDDPYPGVDAEGLRLLLRQIFVAAGGRHDDWPTYDRVMIEERRAAVLIHADRIYPR